MGIKRESEAPLPFPDRTGTRKEPTPLDEAGMSGRGVLPGETLLTRKHTRGPIGTLSSACAANASAKRARGRRSRSAAASACPLCPTHSEGLDLSTWVACSHCGTWFHVVCVGVANVDEYETWYCAACLADTSLDLKPRMYPPRRRSTRERTRPDYAAVEDGRPADPVGRWARLLAQYSAWPDTARRVPGTLWTVDWLVRGDAMNAPVIVPASEHLENPGAHIQGMHVPPRATTIRDVARLVGPDTPVEVIDVQTQMSSSAWTLDEWADYFEMPADKRPALLNVISLEVTGTPMERLVVAPLMVRTSDWVERDSPAAQLRGGTNRWPKVQRYVLMGVEGAFTDWHIDFAASYVYYHVVWGQKLFLFAPPTPANLAAYRAWTSSMQQEREWLGDALCDVRRVEIRTGETMLIPAGWIHAVHTVRDSLVVGGNFLADYHVGMHWRLEELEIATHVPLKFRFPHLVRLAWYVARGWDERLAAHVDVAPCVRMGIEQLCRRLDAELRAIRQGGRSAESAAAAVPKEVPDPEALVAQLRRRLAERT